MNSLFSVRYFESADSTQNVLKDIVSKDGSINHEGLVVYTSNQTNGRGRGKREWLNQNGNLFFSVCLCPDIAPEYIGQLALLCGLATFKGCKESLNNQDIVTLKWPNDLLIDGKKFSGILIESDGVVDGAIPVVFVGIGVNVVSAPSSDFCSMVDVSDNKLHSKDVLENILIWLEHYYKEWKLKGFHDIRAEYLRHTFKGGQNISVKMGDQVITGQFSGVDDFGNLQIHDTNGALNTISSGDVFL